MQKTRKELLYSFLISLVIAVILSILFLTGVFSNIQLKLTDNLYGGKNAMDNIVILAIDDKSLQELGRWPWPREIFVKGFSRLNKTAVVGVDVAFFENYDLNVDKELAAVIKKNNNFVLPVEYTRFESVSGQIAGMGVMKPVGDLPDSARGLGYINIVTDSDGVTRAVNTNVKGEYDSFANEIYKIFIGKDSNVKENRLLINFVGKPGSFQYYSFSDLVNDKIDVNLLDNKIIFVGAVSPDLHDDYFVPTSKGKAMPGVEVHANIMQQLITHNNLQDVSSWIIVLLIFIIALLTGLMLYRFHALITTIVVGLILVFYIILGIVLFDKSNLIVNFIYPVLAGVFSYVFVVLYFYFFEKKTKQEILNAFKKYVSPVLINEIMKDPSKLKLGGDKREVTIMFSDIRGFTSISERLTPEQLVHLLNEYLTEMANIILKNNGVVDKYMGDAIMAFWNAPLDEKEHVYLACLTALEMKEKLIELHKNWESRKIPVLNIGIGINTGDAVVGNMGSYDRFDYTAMGDNINLGSRLEGINKEYGTSIIISNSTHEKIKDKFVCRELDLVAVKGRKEPVRIFELIGKKGEISSDKLKFISHFEEGLSLYRAQKWKDAVKMFEKCLSMEKDYASSVFIERCRFFEKESPGKDWNKVRVMKTK